MQHLHFLRDKDEELKYRRSLFEAAAKGDVRAQDELGRVYHVWIWCDKAQKEPSAQECSAEGRSDCAHD